MESLCFERIFKQWPRHGVTVSEIKVKVVSRVCYHGLGLFHLIKS